MADAFTQAYIECACWSSSDDDGNFFDMSDRIIAAETREKMEADCIQFQHENKELLEKWYETYTEEEAGHDFWLTRNHHGAGFWDRNVNLLLEPISKKLTDASHAFGEFDLYVGDDGQIWGA